MGANGETLLHPLPTATAVLAGIGRRHRHHSTASVCCFALENAPKLRPARIIDALGQVRRSDQVGHPQVFQIDHVVVPQQGERRLMMKVAPLALHRLMLLGQQHHRFPAALTALLPPRDTPLRLLQLPLGFAVVPRIFNDVAVSRDEKHLQADVDTGLVTGGREGLHGHIHAGEAAVPPIRLMGDGDGLERAFKGATPPDGNPADLRQHEAAILERGPVAELLVGERVVVVGTLKAWIAWLSHRTGRGERRPGRHGPDG